MNKSQTKLEKYAENIKQYIKISKSKNAGIIPHIEHQSFKFISVSFDHKQMFHISTSGTDLTPKGAIEYANELEIASGICKELNKCYAEDRNAHIIEQLKHSI
jgi:hypothetical protein